MNYEIHTDRLLLRPLTISDLETVHKYSSDIENTRYMVFLPNETKEETEAFLRMVTEEWRAEQPAFYEFAVVFEGTQIGAVSVTLDETKENGEIGWILNKEYHRRGLAVEAASAVRDFAFHVLKLKKLIAQCDYRNTASYRLMEKIGMTLEDDTGMRTYLKRVETARELTYAIVRKEA